MTDNFVSIERENVPCIYDLDFESETPAIILRINRDFAKRNSISSDAPRVKEFIKRFGFSSFIGDFFRETFGFDDSFLFHRNENAFIVFKILIPVAKKRLYKTCTTCFGDRKSLFGKCLKCNGRGKLVELCERCNGSKKDEEGEVCLNCDGNGIKTCIDWGILQAISASFTVFLDFVCLRLSRSELTSCEFPQLLLINTSTGDNNNSVGGSYSIPLVRWFLSLGVMEITETKKAMIASWQKIWGKVGEYDEYQFRAEISNGSGRLSLSCPGDRCDLYVPHNNAPGFNRGCSFCDHNVDTSAQVITFLSGLAALCGKARKEIKS